MLYCISGYEMLIYLALNHIQLSTSISQANHLFNINTTQTYTDQFSYHSQIYKICLFRYFLLFLYKRKNINAYTMVSRGCQWDHTPPLFKVFTLKWADGVAVEIHQNLWVLTLLNRIVCFSFAWDIGGSYKSDRFHTNCSFSCIYWRMKTPRAIIFQC